MDDSKTTMTKPAKPVLRAKRVVLIASEQTFIEYPVFLRYLLVSLLDESVPVLLVCPAKADQTAILPGVDIVTHPALDIPLMGHFNRKILLDKLKKFNPTILHCLCQNAAPLVRSIARKLDMSYLLNINSPQKRYNRLSISPHRLSRIIVPAESIADNIRELFHKYADRIRLINMGCFVDESSMCFSDSSVLPSLLVADELDGVGRFQNLLSSVKDLTVEGYEFILVIMGKGQGEDAVREYVRKNGLSEHVIIVPRLESERFVLQDCDMYIQPWPGDSYNAMAIEAMATGSAVLSCPGGVDDMFRDRENCLLFDPTDQISIRTAIKELLDKHEFAIELAENAKEYVKQNHSMSKMVESLRQLYTG